MNPLNNQYRLFIDFPTESKIYPTNEVNNYYTSEVMYEMFHILNCVYLLYKTNALTDEAKPLTDKADALTDEPNALTDKTKVLTDELDALTVSCNLLTDM